MPTNPADDSDLHDPMDEFWRIEIHDCKVSFIDDGFRIDVIREYETCVITLHMPCNPNEPIDGQIVEYFTYFCGEPPDYDFNFQIVGGEIVPILDDWDEVLGLEFAMRDIKLALKKIGESGIVSR